MWQHLMGLFGWLHQKVLMSLQEFYTQRYGLQKTTVAVQGCRSVTKASMVHNSHLPKMEIDPQRYTVRADGELLVCEAATRLPMAQRYFLF